MKKILYWTIGIHLVVGGFLPAVLEGVTYKELDALQHFISNLVDSFETAKKMVKYLPWI